jgi:CheY-like chemotaxis protein
MSITKRIVDTMNGEITVASEPGKGTTFTVRIPQKRTSGRVCGPELAEKLQSHKYKRTTMMKRAQFVREYMPYGSVMIVDDVESNLYVAKGMLVPYGLKVDTAMSGLEAIELVESGKTYDIILMDHMMPKMDGIEATKRIRDTGYTRPIVALTANALVGQAEMFMANGFDGFLSKPIDSRELNAALNNFIRDRKPLEVVDAARAEQAKERAAAPHPQEDAIDPNIAAAFLRDSANVIKVYNEVCVGKTDMDDDALDRFTTAIHGIKTALTYVRQPKLSAVAARLEKCGNDRDAATILSDTPEFFEELQAVIEEVKNLLPVKVESQVDASEEDVMLLRESLTELHAACKAFDIKSARELLASLKEKSWPSGISEGLERISVHVLHSSFKKAAAETEKVFEELVK